MKHFLKQNGLKIFTVLSLCLALGAPITMSAANGDGSLTDGNIKYIGRWDTSSSTIFHSYWGGAYLRVNFTGTTVKVKLAAVTSFAAKIDSGAYVRYNNQSGTVNLTPTPLANGTHTLMVIAKYADDELQFQGLILDAGATTQPPANRPFVEFIGDSITAGQEAGPSAANESISDYAWLTGEQLGADHTQIAYPGITLVTGYHYSGLDIPGMENAYFKLKQASYATSNGDTTYSPDWNFAKYTPNIVVINLGVNDNGVSPSVPPSTFQSHYITYLANLRAKFPNAELFAMGAIFGEYATETANAVTARNNAGDSKVHYFRTDTWLTSSDLNPDGHPNQQGHNKITQNLVPILQPYLNSGPTNTPPPPTNTPTRTNTPPPPTATPLGTVTIDDSVQGTGQNQFNYVGTGWSHCTNCNEGGAAVFYNASQSWNITTNSSVTIAFTGTQIKYYAVKAPDVGIAAVSIDGGAETNVDLYMTPKTGNVLVWTSPTLTNGSHTFKVRNTGTKNASSAGMTITLDRVDILTGGPTATPTATWTNTPIGPTNTPTSTPTRTNTPVTTATPTPTRTNTPAGTTTVDDSVQGTGQNQWNYTGAGWSHCTNCNETNPPVTYYNASQSYDVTTNDSVTIAFTGTQIKFYAVLGDHHGKAGVSIDGGTETSVDLYATTKQGNMLVYTSPVLAAGSHTFKVRVTGTKNASSSDFYIPVDRVDIIP